MAQGLVMATSLLVIWHSALTGRGGWGKVPGLDGPIRANRFAASRESGDSRESHEGSRTSGKCKVLIFLRV